MQRPIGVLVAMKTSFAPPLLVATDERVSLALFVEREVGAAFTVCVVVQSKNER